VLQLLDDVVVVFDPMHEPDGRERFLAMLARAPARRRTSMPTRCSAAAGPTAAATTTCST
jgi:hypothetical protein